MTTRKLTFDECESLGLDGTGIDGRGPWFVTNEPKCTGHIDKDGDIAHDGYTCPIHETRRTVRIDIPSRVEMVIETGGDEPDRIISAEVYAEGGNAGYFGETFTTEDKSIDRDAIQELLAAQPWPRPEWNG